MTRDFSITGTFHGSIVTAETEGEARKMFHKHYKGESIISIRDHQKQKRIKKVKTKKDYLKRIKEICELKDCKQFHCYKSKKYFIIIVEEKRFVFDFQEYKSEKIIDKLIEETVKIINKKYFLQLELFVEEKNKKHNIDELYSPNEEPENFL